MIKLLGKLPYHLPIVAMSGGVDSMAAADFVSRTRTIQCAFFHHGTETSERAEHVVRKFCEDRKIVLMTGRIWNSRPADLSPEEHWRNERYAWLDSISGNSIDIITAHHLDDCVETYLWSAMHGTPKTIPYRRNRVVRPFLLTPKQSLVNWATRHNVPWIEDLSNTDTKYMRNYVRHNIVPHALKVNPGLRRVIARKVVDANLDEFGT